jgi:DNA-binding response OmpR family regulator
MTVLVCEDEEIMLTALEFRLRRQGFNVAIARDGDEAIKMLADLTPDVLVTDIMMPKVTGLELITHVRANVSTTMPVIVISAIELDEVILEAFKLGANDFITKPFKPNELVLRIRRLIQEQEREAS